MIPIGHLQMILPLQNFIQVNYLLCITQGGWLKQTDKTHKFNWLISGSTFNQPYL